MIRRRGIASRPGTARALLVHMRRPIALLFASSALVLAASASAQPAPSLPPPPPSAPLQAQAPVPAPYGHPPMPLPYGHAPGLVWLPPAPARPVDKGTDRRNLVMTITGFSLAGAGAALSIVGGVLYSLLTTYSVAHADCVRGPCSSSEPTIHRPPGALAAIVAGGVLFSVGLPIGIYGAVRRNDEAARKAAPELALGLSSAHLRWSF
jgi:hypothetical protein